MAKYAKWYVNVGKWKPSKEEWLKLTSCIAEEEVERINKYVYQDDSKASLIGRTLIRKFVSQALNRPSNELIFTRNSHGRPEIGKHYKSKFGTHWPKVLDFNVSHSGDYCVLAGVWDYDVESSSMTIGVDITKIVRKPTRQELDRFLDLMSRREFLPQEWRTVTEAKDERQKCINFTRLWCLKESFIKSIGLGLTFKLNRICFQPNPVHITTEMLKDKIISDTRVELDGVLTNDWRFQETALDDDHLVALGYNLTVGTDFPDLDESSFIEIDIDSIISALDPLTEVRESNWTKFSTSCTKR